jgi:CDP-glucose 4,6-dehydratase
LDALSGYLLLANHLVANKDFSSWNFASDETNLATVADVCDMVAGLWGREATWVTDSSSNPHEAGLLLLNAKKAEAVLGWRNKLGVKDAIKWTLDWEKSARASDARQASYAQITKYLKI